MRNVRIGTTAIFAPLPIQNWRCDSPIVNDVFDPLVAAFSALANLLD